MEMRGLMSSHVVRFTWIDEEVGLSAVLDALLDESQRMLWYHHWVIETDDDLQLTFEILGFGPQT